MIISKFIYRFILIGLSVFILGFASCYDIANTESKKYDLVLIHGFTNRHQWGNEFLARLASIWGAGRVFVIYIDENSDQVRNYSGITYIGQNTYEAGSQSLNKQAEIVNHKIEVLKREHNLSSIFSVASHSMGGVVARKLLYLRPKEIADLVAIASPHMGTPLTEEYMYMFPLVGDKGAAYDITPQGMKAFNQKYPIKSELFYDKQGKLYTIEGSSRLTWRLGWSGWNGELAFGWALLKLKYGFDNDGVILQDGSSLENIVPYAKFSSWNHLQLIHQGSVAQTVAEALR